VQLLDAKDGTHLWADKYDRDLSASDIFAVQDEITEQVVGTIAGDYGVVSRVRFSEVNEKPTESLDVYECVLKYLAYERGNFAATEYEEVRACLERAVKSDPGYSKAWACLGHIYVIGYSLNYSSLPNLLDRALDAAQRALALDATSQDAHHVLAAVHFHRQELDAFFAEEERAVALNPSHASVLAWAGLRFGNAGDKRGIGLVRKAMKLDPFLPSILNFSLARHHFETGEHEEALAAARRINAPAFFYTHIYLGAIYAELGRQEEAAASVEKLLRLYPGFTIEKLIEERRKWNEPDDMINRWVSALRKAGLPED
jgi:adenylate cyclase